MYANQLSISTDPVTQRTKEAIVLARQLQEGGALYLRANAQVAARLSGLTDHLLNYVVHEYQNEAWDCFYFFDVANELERDSKLTFGCSAVMLDSVASISVQPEAREMLAEIASPLMREQVRDFWVNAGFRRDLFLRGAVKLQPAQAQQQIAETRLVPVVQREIFSFKAKGPYCEFNLDEQTYSKVVDKLYSSREPVRIGDLQRDTGLHWPAIREAAIVLVSLGYAAPCHEETVAQKQRPKCKALNRAIRERARFDASTTYQASPLTGVGVQVGRMEQLFLSALDEGVKTPDGWAEHAHASLERGGQALQNEGQNLSREESLAKLTGAATTFDATRLALLRRLGIV